MSIGFFDSGVGGITVLKEALKLLPEENYVYFADTKHVPYGTKSKEEIKGYIFEAVAFLAGKGIKMLVVACNTATSIGIQDLRSKYDFPVLGMEPAVKPAIEKNGKVNKRVLVTATPLTLKEEKFQNLVSKLDSDNIVDVLPLPELVDFAERLEFSGQVVLPYLKDKFDSFPMYEYGTVVLGCTHFPLFRNAFKEILPRHIEIIDGNSGTVKHMRNVLLERGLTNLNEEKGNVTFYSSGDSEMETMETAKLWKVFRMS